jgi:hypothetical protein
MEIKKYWIVNCYSMQINSTVVVDGIQNEDMSVSYPAIDTWDPKNRFKAFRFQNWGNVNKLKTKAQNFYFESESEGKIFVDAFKRNASVIMKKNYLNKKNVKHKEYIKKAMNDLSDMAKKEFVFEVFDISYDEHQAKIKHGKEEFEKYQKEKEQ